MSELEKLKNQLSQLEKTYQSGIISEEEYKRGRNTIEKKLKPLKDKEKKNEESKKIINEIISKKDSEKVEKKEEKKEEKKKDKKQAKKDDSPKDATKKKDEEKITPVKDTKKEDTKKELAKDSKKKETKTKEKKTIKKEKKKKKSGFFWVSVLILLSLVLFLLLSKTTEDDLVISQKNLTNVTKVANVEFYSSFSCDPCHELDLILDKLSVVYQDNIVITKIHYPLDLEKDLVLDKAYYCVNELDSNKTEEFKNFLFEEKKPIRKIKIDNYLKKNNVDLEAFDDCFNDLETLYIITNNYKKAINDNVAKIPTIFINNQKIEGLKHILIYEAIIDRILKIDE
ncbi:MAG: DsbA family protein [Candidatus Woesearchaeota archaeon]